VLVFRDITERKKAEEEMQESENRLNRSQEIAHLGSWELDLVKNKLSWSDEVYRIFGLKPQEFGATYDAFLQAVYSEDREAVDAAYSGSLREGRDTYEIEHRVERKLTGEIRIVYEKCEHFRDQNGRIIRSVGMVQDITDRKMMEAKLEEYSKHLENLVEERTKQLKDSERLAAIGATAGMVGHDIRNPLQSITSDVYLAKTELGSTSESEEKKNALESLEEIEKSVSYINKIVADLQDFARPLSPRFEEIDFEQTVHSVLAHLNIPGNVIVKHSVRKDFPKLNTDPSYLQRIIANLANNAIQAMPKGGKLTISAVSKNGRAMISVEDNGEGIPDEVRARMFTPLVTTKSKGQGFGLSVVKRFTEALGGAVTFESEVGKGTKFTIELPI
jgi:PAS domain S-box-containing protein